MARWDGGFNVFFLWDLNRILIGFNGSDGILLRFYGFVWRFWRDFSNGFDVKWFVLGKIWLVTSNFQIYRWHFPQDLSYWTATSLTSKTYPPVKLIAMEILCISRKWSTNAGRCSSKKTGWWCDNHLEKYESQLEGWYPIYYGKKIPWFETTNQNTFVGR